MDESKGETLGGLCYVLGSVVLVADPEEALMAINQVVRAPGRQRPFHWAEEGPQARERMLTCLVEIGAVGFVCVHSPTAIRGAAQEQARVKCLDKMIPLLLGEGVTKLRIEQRANQQDIWDRQTLTRKRKELGLGRSDLDFSHSPKTDRLLWPADALAGAVREYLMRMSDHYFEEFQAKGIMGAPIYLTSS